MAPKTTAEYLAELGRTQKAYQEYGSAGRSDLQQNASNYGNDLRQQAKSSGIDLSQYGTKNQYGQDYTSYYNGGTAGVYDPSKTGQVETSRNIGTTTAAPTTGGGSGIDIPGMYNNFYASQAQKLKDMRDRELAGLAGQDQIIKQNRISSLNNNDAMATQQLRALREGQANAGVNGGDSVTAQIANQTAQGQNANGIETNAGNQLKQLQAMKDQINNASSANDLALLQGLQAQQAQTQLGQYNQDRQFGIQEGGLTGLYNGNPTQSMLNQQFNQGMANKQFDYQQARDLIKDKQYQQQFDQNEKQWGLDYAIKKAQADNQMNNMSADNSRQQGTANFNNFMDVWKATGKAPYDMNLNGTMIKKDSPYGNGGSGSGFALNDYKKQVDQKFYAPDPKNPKNKVFDGAGARSYILNLNIPFEQIAQLLDMYGLPLQTN